MVEFLGGYDPKLKLADLHVHTTESDGLLSPIEVVELARTIGLSAVAVTDHEVTKGGKLAREYCQNQGYDDLEVISGTEISTKGHLLGLFIKEDVPSGKPLAWTIQAIHEQGGLVVAPHPFLTLTRHLGRKNLMSVIDNPHPDVYFDGFEIWNSAICAHPWIESFTNGNERAKEFYLNHRESLGAAVGGTDAHCRTIGLGLTGYSGNLYDAIRNNQTVVLYSSKEEIVSWQDRLRQSYQGLIVEPKRRVKRYARRELIGQLIREDA